MLLLLASLVSPAFADAQADALIGQLQDHLQGAPDADHGDCLTGLVADIKQHWDGFTPAQRAELNSVLVPWGGSLVQPAPPSAGVDAPPDDSCGGYYYDNYIDGEHFSVQWESGAINETQAQSFLDALEFSWQTEIDELGWKPPSGVDTYRMRVLVPDDDSYAGAYTTTTSCSGVGDVPYIVAYSGSFSAGNWYKSMACHEFNHASQFGYGDAHEFWWWEATATYVQEYVYPDYNDWADMTYVFSLVPYIGMNAFAGRSNDQWLFYHTYSMAIWAFFLDQKVGGHDLVRETWEYAESSWGYYSLWMPDLIDDVAPEYGRADFSDLYLEFMATNAVMEYDESNYFQTPDTIDTVVNLPDSGDGDGDLLPQSLGQNFIRFRSSAGVPEGTLRVSFDGADDADGWYALLVRGSRSVEEYVVFDLDDAGQGTAEIAFEGDKDVYLVVSPVYDDAQGYSYSWSNPDEGDYTWSAELLDPNAVPEDTGAADDTGGAVSDDADGKGVCGCSAGGLGTSVGLVWLLGLVGVVRRRR